MKCSIVNYKKLNEHDDWRWDGEYLCFKPGHNKKYSYKPIGDILACSQYGISIDMNEEGNGYKIYRMNEMSNMFCDRRINKHADILLDQMKKFKLKNNDVLFNRTNSQEFVGRTGIFKKFSDEDIVFASYLIRVRTNEDEVLPEYLVTFLNTKYGVQDVKRRARISINQSNINAEELKRVKIPIISKQIQEQIRNIFDKSFELINESELFYSQAEQTLLFELKLSNWKPKHQLSFVKNYSDTQTSERIDAEYFQPMYEEITKSITLSKDYACLGDLATIKKCIEPGSEAYQEDGVLFLRVSNLSKLGFKDGNQQYLTEELYKILKQYQPKKGEILLSKDATPGIAYYLKDKSAKMVPSGGILRLKINSEDKIYPEYLTLVLNSVIVQKQIERNAGGSIIKHWLVDQVKNTLIPILPLAKQKKIAEMTNESFYDRELSKQLLDIAKRGVELAIEKNEKQAEKWVDDEVKRLDI